jgi:uncharacterized protein YdhG (YjbR/CyaY superfamily)
MSFQAYLDNIKAKTGKTPADFKKLAEKKGILKPDVKAGEVVKWLKEDFDLGHGHAMAIWAVFSNAKIPGNQKQKTEEKKPKKQAAPGKKVGVKDIDTYISMQPAESRPGLEKMRAIIRSAAPKAEEVISYGMPAFRYHGMLVGFADARNHYGFYPWTGRTVAQFKEELEGTVHRRALSGLIKASRCLQH